jgi:hypothetical protein
MIAVFRGYWFPRMPPTPIPITIAASFVSATLGSFAIAAASGIDSPQDFG